MLIKKKKSTTTTEKIKFISFKAFEVLVFFFLFFTCPSVFKFVYYLELYLKQKQKTK